MTDTIEELAGEFAVALEGAGVHYGHGAVTAEQESALLIGGYLRSKGRKTLAAGDEQALRALLQSRIEDRMPVAYLTGEGWFAGHRFLLPAGVMIPRSPIAEMIEARFAPWLRRDPDRILDLCSGSGCIGISAALMFPNAELTLVDIDPLANETARRNAAYHGIQTRTEIVEQSLFDGLGGRLFDLVLANPPYVADDEFADLPVEYRHEPTLGLVAGSDGLDLWRAILGGVSRHMSNDGLLVGEVGNTASALLDAFALPFFWPELEHAEQRLADGSFGVFVLDASALA